MENKLKRLAKYLIAILGLSLGVVVGVSLLELHDLRVLLAVAAGMFLGQPAFNLASRIKALQERDEDSDLI